MYAILKQRSGDPIGTVERWWVIAAAFVGAAVGSKLLVLVDHPSLFASGLDLVDGKSIVGALVGALLAVEWTKQRIGVSQATGDVFAIPLVVGIAIGRIGCFLTGLDDNTHGLPASLPWAVDFGDGVPRHPAQLYEVTFLALVLLPALLWLRQRGHAQGDLFKVFMIGYLGFRLGLEFLKPGDPIVGLNGDPVDVPGRPAGTPLRIPQRGEPSSMADRVRPYLFYDVAVSICSTCYRKVEGKIVFEDGCVYMLKRCPDHGGERVLMADDVDYYRRCREVFIKPPEMPNVFNTPVRWGCPYDCGLCADHQQHSCLTPDRDDRRLQPALPDLLRGAAARTRQAFRSLADIEAMLDAVVRNEGEPDVVQISGGEPTLHPEFFDVLDAAKQRPIKHLMVNTNGMRIAQDEAFAERLAAYMPGFEVYLQFDSLEARARS